MSDQNQLTYLIDVDLLSKLVVGIGEVSEVTGVPVRKLRYWEDKGIINSVQESEGSNRRYNYLTVKKILLIKELLDEGYILEAASRKVEERFMLVEQAFSKLRKSTQDGSTTEST